MKLIESYGPNPRVVRMFLEEKGIELAREEIDLMGGESHRAPYLERNPTGTSPCLELDDGSVIGETVAICELLEELHPSPVLIGADPYERARSRMWMRRVELNLTEHMYNAFRYGEGLDHFRERFHCIPEAADGLKAKARTARVWLDGLIAGRDFIAGDSITLADIILFCCWDFVKDIGQPIEPDLENLHPWYERMRERPSATASIHPLSQELGWVG